MEKQNKTNTKNEYTGVKCEKCKGNGYVKTGYDVKPYVLCNKCKGEPLEVAE